MSDILIDTDKSKGFFRLANCANELVANKRLIVSLKRLNYSIENNDLIIPYNEKVKINTLDEIERLLSKFGFSRSLSQKTSTDVESYQREQLLFNEFSDKARNIRNDNFDSFPELIQNFDEFQKILKSKLERTLYPIQLLSAFHMAFSQNACNFAVPGAGKTSIVYAAYAYLKSLPVDDPKHVDRLLVVGPLSSFAPWENEYFECFGQKVKSQRLSGDISVSRRKKEQHLYSGDPAELTLIFHGGLDMFQKEIIDFLKAHKTMVVIDEAHRIKNPEGVWGKSAVEVSKEARARVVLTGTPVPNGYEDLFNLFRFIYPFRYKSVLDYHYTNLQDMTKNNDPESERVQKFTENISPYFIRIKKEDLKLPPRIEEIVEVKMDVHQREIYDFIETSYVNSFQSNPNGTVKDVLNRAKMIRLRQASTNPALLANTLKDSLANNLISDEVDPNIAFTTQSDEFVSDSEFFNKICNYSKIEVPSKFIEIEKILKTHGAIEGTKVIIWTIFIQNAKELRQYLDDRGMASRLLIGEIDQIEREDTITKFNDPNNSDFQIVIANPFSVAESISLHKGCHTAIYLERDYNCSNFLQSKDRIHRVGLPENQITKYYYIVSEKSIDGIIEQKLKTKIERMEAIIDGEIPLISRINDQDETDLIKALMIDYAQRT